MAELKLLGRIDLDEYMQGRSVPVRKSGIFKLLSIECSFYNQAPIVFDFGKPLNEANSKGGYFSLLLGKNGVCKSSLLRELIEFFIDARRPNSRKKKTNVRIISVTYIINGDTYYILNNDGFHYSKNGQDVRASQMIYPLIIASTMGMFDKFPVNSQAKSKNGRYDIEYYHYVGPKASNNMFTSKANVLLQQLSALPSVKNENQLELLGVLLEFIGYESTIVLRFEPKDQNYRLAAYKEHLSPGHENLYNEICNGRNNFDMLLRKDGFDNVKQLPLHSLNYLRQNGYLKRFKCYFFKDGQEVDSDYLSSGEFNLLCIVMSVILAADSRQLLLLLDEPEISQHPNWQLDLIPNLEKALVDYGCHFLIATHCHFLVSNLPIGRSNVICMKRNDNNQIEVESIPSDTYGWSAEEVLLKAFGVPTDRSRYLAQMVSDFLKEIGERSIDKAEVSKKITFFKEMSQHLNSYDPMKKILDTIIKEFAL